MAAGHLGLRLASAAAAVATVAVIGVVVLSLLDGRGSVAGPGMPTLPPVIQPSLPSAAANPTTIRDGAWVSPTVAWLVDDQNRLRMTTDGGLTWSAPRPLPQDDLRGDPRFLDASFGFAMWARPGTDPVEVVLYATHDGGRTWASTTVGTLPTDDTNSLSAHFVDALRGIVVAGSYHQGPVPSGSFGRGLTQAASAGWSTDDGGRTWASLPDAPCSNDDVWASAEVGLIFPVVDGGPRVSVTTDGGRTWRQGALPGVADSAFPAPAVFIVTDDGVPRLGYYVTKNTDRAGDPRTLIVAETRDGGATWQEAYETPTAGLSAVTAFGPGHWLTSGASAFGPERCRARSSKRPTADGRGSRSGRSGPSTERSAGGPTACTGWRAARTTAAARCPRGRRATARAGSSRTTAGRPGTGSRSEAGSCTRRRGGARSRLERAARHPTSVSAGAGSRPDRPAPPPRPRRIVQRGA